MDSLKSRHNTKYSTVKEYVEKEIISNCDANWDDFQRDIPPEHLQCFARLVDILVAKNQLTKEEVYFIVHGILS